MKSNVTLISTLSILGFATAAHASLMLYEGFDYSAGGLAGENGGSGFSTSWASSGAGGDTVTYPGSTYISGADSLSVTGGYAAVTNSGTAGAFRDFSTIVAPDGVSSYWISLIASTGGIAFGSGGDEASIQIRDADNTDLISVGAFGSSANWRIRAKSADGSVSGFSNANDAPNSGASAFILIQVNVDTTAADNIYFWVNPSLDNEPTIVTATSSITGTNFWDSGDFSINRIRAGLNNSGAAESKTLNYDEYRFGTSFADVAPIPEPSHFALIAAGLVMLLGYFRRKH